VTVHTDHRPLVSISKKALTSTPKRLQRMLLRLKAYDYELIYRPGSEMAVSDTLSRAYSDNTDGPKDFDEELASLTDDEQLADIRLVASERTMNLIRVAADDDEQYKQLRKQIAVGWPAVPTHLPAELREFHPIADELVVCHGLIYEAQRLLIPVTTRIELLDRIHSSHIGVNGCMCRAREAVFWPGMTRAIESTVSQ